jgi:predicted aconitase
VELGGALVREGARTYIIDDAELERVQREYPCIWKDNNAEPKLCFVGCPHLSLSQLNDWTEKLDAALEKAGRRKIAVPTVFTAAPAVLAEFNKTGAAEKLKRIGVITSDICPLMYMNNPLCGKTPVITNSNKLRTYTSARYYRDSEILEKLGGAK